MTNERNVWYQMGYALERARGHVPGAGSLAGARPEKPTEAAAPAPAEDAAPPSTKSSGTTSLTPLVEKALALAAVAGGGAMVTAALRAWRPRHRPGPIRLVRAGAAGAGAAVVRMLFRHVTGLDRPGEDPDPLRPILAGTARGLVYASVVEPRLPGPPVLRGATYGALEFAAAPWGGLEGLLDTIPPHRRVPFLAALLDARDDDPSLSGHLLFGVVLASLYGEPSD